MNLIVSMHYSVLYILWAVLFAVTAALGFVFPQAEGATRFVLQLVTGLFFIPPWAILIKANRDEEPKHKSIIKSLAILSLAATTLLICLSILAANHANGREIGNILHAILTVVSAPMVCSNMYVLPLFLWGTLLMGAMSRPVAKR